MGWEGVIGGSVGLDTVVGVIDSTVGATTGGVGKLAPTGEGTKGADKTEEEISATKSGFIGVGAGAETGCALKLGSGLIGFGVFGSIFFMNNVYLMVR